MMVYIEKQRLIEAVRAHKGYFQDQKSTLHMMLKDEIKDIVDDMPPDDVAPVIRCKDCKHKRVDECGNVWCGRNWSKFLANDYDFCSRGERKEG